MSFVPRDYQIAADEALWRHLHAHPDQNPLVVLPTGTGKSLCMAMICWRLLAAYPHVRIMNLTHVKELIEGNYKTQMKLWPAAPAGIYSSGLDRRDVYAQLTFGGVQSVVGRVGRFGHIDFLIIDEAHRLSDGDSNSYMKLIKALKEKNPNLIVIGFTATPFRMGSGSLLDGKMFDSIAFDGSDGEAFVWFLQNGYLIRPVPADPGFQVDDTGIGVVGGDFNNKQASAALNEQHIIERAVDHAIKLGNAQNRKAWLTFCQSIEDAELTADMFRSRGIPFDVVHSKRRDRDDVIEKFKRGELRGIANKDILCLSEDTEILTSLGFVGIDDMTYDHTIAAWREDGGIDWTPPEFIIRRGVSAGEKIIEATGRAAQFSVTGNHRMVTLTGAGVKVQAAESLLGSQFKIPTFGTSTPNKIEVEQPSRGMTRQRMLKAERHKYKKRGFENYDELAETEVQRKLSLRYLNPDELSLDHCAFIGFWMGDGTIAGRCQVSQSMRYSDTVTWFDELVQRLGYGHSRHIKPKGKGGLCHDAVIWSFARGTGGMSQERKGYYEIEPYLTKAGSRYMLGFTRDQLLALLHGFWLADGLHHDASGNKQKKIVGTQLELYELLQELCAQRGVSASIKKMGDPAKEYHAQQYTLRWSERSAWSYTSDSTKQRGPRPGERVWCITSSTSYLICRRAGKVFVTGNTTGFDYPAIDMILMLRLTRSPGLWVQMLGRGTRPVYVNGHYGDGGHNGFDLNTIEGRLASIAASPKQTCLVLDYVGNTMRLGPINYPVKPKKRGKGGDEPPVRICRQCSPNTYHHTSVKVCPECGFVFPEPEAHIQKSASKAELVIDMSDIVIPEPEPKKLEVFEVQSMTCTRHKGKRGKPDTMKVLYQCKNYRLFSTYICIEHPAKGYARKRAEQWWKQHSNSGRAPNSIDEALEEAARLNKPYFIQVWTNRDFPEIVGYDFVGTRFELPPEAGGPPLQKPTSINEETPDWRANDPGGYFDDDIPF